jgi:glucose/arabinose dehydrogenase
MLMQVVVARTALVAIVALAAPLGAQGIKSPTPESRTGVVVAETYAEGLQHPWGMAFLPDGRMLVTERPGRLRIVARDGSLSDPLTGVPEVMARGQGGLLDVAIDPNFATNRMVYLSFSEPGAENTAGTAVAKGRLGTAGLENVQVIWSQQPKVRSNQHYGSRLVFRNDGTLFITTGDRGNQRPLVQDLGATIGKVIRINTDGSIPRDNPFVGRTGARSEIWSYGHRNMQGATLAPDGTLWTTEHGPRGGDELNRTEAGKNYGWPVITYGEEYQGGKIGEGTAKTGMEQPIWYWNPVIAASGLTFYTGDAIPGWKGSILAGSMTPGGLVRLEMQNGRVVKEERYLVEMKERFRAVKQGPDGFVYVLTDQTAGRILRIKPAGR